MPHRHSFIAGSDITHTSGVHFHYESHSCTMGFSGNDRMRTECPKHTQKIISLCTQCDLAKSKQNPRIHFLTHNTEGLQTAHGTRGTNEMRIPETVQYPFISTFCRFHGKSFFALILIQLYLYACYLPTSH